MELFEKILIVAGTLCIVTSFVLSYWFHLKSKQTEMNGEQEQTEQKEDGQIEAVIQLREEVLSTLRDEMNRMANEKMMAIHEYSEGILEKLQNNQNETVFLYKMLNDKEEAIKSLMGSKPKEEQETKEQEDTIDYETFLADYHSNKEKIVALHEKKVSIVDISKQLNIGQGEVMLVLNLYGRKE